MVEKRRTLFKNELVDVEVLERERKGRKGVCDFVYVLTFGDGKENRMNLFFLDHFNSALNAIEKEFSKQEEGSGATLITTSLSKFYSNGIDLNWLGKQDTETQVSFMEHLSSFVARFLEFPMPTIAALNGHTYAGGFFFALSQDLRLMRADRGWMRLPAVELGLRLPDFLLYIAIDKLSSQVRQEAVLHSKRYTAFEAQKAGLVQHVVGTLQDVKPKAIEIAFEMAPACAHRETYRSTKQLVNSRALENLRSSSGYHMKLHSKL